MWPVGEGAYLTRRERAKASRASSLGFLLGVDSIICSINIKAGEQGAFG